jgi:hypothetical protein
MTKFARFTLTTMLLGSLALPAVAQSGITSNVPMQPTAKVLPGVHHRTAGHSNHVHRVADAVRTPTVTSGNPSALPAPVASKNVAADGKTAMGSSASVHGKDATMESKATAMPVAPAPTPSTTPHAAVTATTNPGLPHIRQ